MALLDILAFTATISTYGMFLVGVVICRTIYRKGSVGEISAVPFVMCATSCFFWLQYGFLKRESTIINVNLLGLALEIAYVLFYYFYCGNKTYVNLQIILGIAASCIIMMHLKFSGHPDPVLVNHLGMLCLLLNVLNFAAPLVAVKDVVIQKSTESLSFALCVANLLVSGQWLLFGMMIDDFYMKVPNAIGFLLTLIQLSLFAIYPSTSGVGQKFASQ